MSYNTVVVLVGWLVVAAIFFSFIILLRYLHHKERMALITHGMHPDIVRKQQRSSGILRAGLITGMVGLALTIGLYPLGFFLPFAPAAPFHLGPWLLPGLIPLAVGLALIISYYLEQNNQASEEEHSEPEQENIISLERHMDRDL